MINLTSARSVLSPLLSTATYRPTCTSILGKGPIVAGRYSNSLTQGRRGASLISPTWYVLLKIVRSLSRDSGNCNENDQKAMGVLSKRTTLRLPHTFLNIPLSLLHDHKVKLRSFTFYEDRREHKTIAFFCMNLDTVDLELIP